MRKKTLKRLVHDFKGFTKDEEVGGIDKVVADMANISNMDVAEDDMRNS